jgi:hypothetical protein
LPRLQFRANVLFKPDVQMVLADEMIIADERKRSQVRLEERRMSRIPSDEPDLCGPTQVQRRSFTKIVA